MKLSVFFSLQSNIGLFAPSIKTIFRFSNCFIEIVEPICVDYHNSRKRILRLERIYFLIFIILIEKGKSYCSSVFQHKMEPNSSRHYAGIFDVAYDSVGVDELKYVIADYVSTSMMNKSAGRYYITPIISMIKCLDKDTILKEMNNLVKIITFHNLPSAFRSEGTDDQHSILFIYALIETILTLGESDLSIASNAICEQIIKSSQINSDSLIRQLSMVPIDIISGLHKKAFMQIMFSMESEKN